jgi:hypothetical protein
MHIVTSSFFTKLPHAFARISIARWAPKGDSELPAVLELAPGEWFRSVDVDEYRRRYLAQLASLDPLTIVRKIEDLAGDRPAALLCWERPRDSSFCHRGYVSAWLHDGLDLEVPEFGLEGSGCGHYHPKLPPHFRLPAQGSLL